MFDKNLAREILSQMCQAISRINRRFSGITSANDFLASDEGIDRLDAIGMMLIALGESCKNLDKVTGGDLLNRYPEIDWKGVRNSRYFEPSLLRSRYRGRLLCLQEAHSVFACSTRSHA